MGFFPATLDEAAQHKLPGKFRPSMHHLSDEAVLDLELTNDAIPRHVTGQCAASPSQCSPYAS